jgi:hypothetical protein
MEQEKRRTLIYLSLVVIALGMASRILHFENAIFNKYLGDALYAILLYLLISILVGNISSITKGAIVFVFMIALELFQLTQIPLTFGQNKNVLIRFIATLLGTVFSWLDVLAYVVGIVVIAFIDKMTGLWRKLALKSRQNRENPTVFKKDVKLCQTFGSNIWNHQFFEV